MLSTRHQWFPCGPLLVSHLTRFFPGLFLLCSRPWLLPTAAEGGSEPTPVSRFRGTFPHRLSSYTLRGPFGPLSARGATSSAKASIGLVIPSRPQQLLCLLDTVTTSPQHEAGQLVVRRERIYGIERCNALLSSRSVPALPQFLDDRVRGVAGHDPTC